VSLNGYMGISPIEANAETVGQSIALLQHGSNVFRNGATLGGFLKVAGKLSPEAAAQLSNSLSNSHAGVSNAGRIMVLENGSDFSPTVMSSEEAQYLEARGFSVTEIARLFRVPPSRIGELSEAHFNNLESQNQDFIDSTLLPNARRMEQEFERVMLFAGEQGKYRIRFDFDEMLRGDISTRYNSYSVGLNNGFLSRNEVRAMEGRPPVPGGETYLTPLNMGDASKPDDPMPSET
jgi:HK97 family phage portal protein